MTEAIHLLAVSQVTFITKIDEKIEKSIQNANIKQCSSCKAMKHTTDIEEEEKWKEKIAEYKEKMGITDDNDPKSDNNSNLPIINTIKQILLKPYFWVFFKYIGIQSIWNRN